jgi:hypothetical protein
MKYKVAVVGGGPSGACAAEIFAQEKGIDTVLFERKLDNAKPCGGAIPLCMVGEFDLPETVVDRKVRTSYADGWIGSASLLVLALVGDLVGQELFALVCRLDGSTAMLESSHCTSKKPSTMTTWCTFLAHCQFRRRLSLSSFMVSDFESHQQLDQQPILFLKISFFCSSTTTTTDRSVA